VAASPPASMSKAVGLLESLSTSTVVGDVPSTRGGGGRSTDDNDDDDDNDEHEENEDREGGVEEGMLLRHSSLGLVRLDRDLHDDDVHAALGSLSGRYEGGGLRRAGGAQMGREGGAKQEQQQLVRSGSSQLLRSLSTEAIASTTTLARSASLASTSLDDAVLLATAAMGSRDKEDGSPSFSSASQTSSSSKSENGSAALPAEDIPHEELDEEEGTEFSQLSQDSAIRV